MHSDRRLISIVPQNYVEVQETEDTATRSTTLRIAHETTVGTSLSKNLECMMVASFARKCVCVVDLVADASIPSFAKEVPVGSNEFFSKTHHVIGVRAKSRMKYRRQT
jgi:hypothetical protein